MSLKSILAEAARRAKEGNQQYSYDDLIKIRQEGNSEFICEIAQRKKESAAHSITGRSGIMPLHQGCTIENYEAQSHEQLFARDFSQKYIETFNQNFGSGFIFSGLSGTGKNHLASAICNELMNQDKTCLVITVTELMMKMRKCYGKDPECAEDEFIRRLVQLDLMVIDEIGLQKKSDHESIILNQIIDQRIGNLKPTGLLTNIDAQAINECLGVRIMDRMRSNGGQWISFTWGSHRK